MKNIKIYLLALLLLGAVLAAWFYWQINVKNNSVSTENRNTITTPDELIKAHYTLTPAGVYYYDQIIEGADPTTFHNIGNGYSADAKNIYLSWSAIQGADPNTFSVIDGNTFVSYGKDSAHVYAKDVLLPGIDPTSFVYLGGNFFKDKNGVYYIDLNSFKHSLVKYADVASFESVGYLYAKDKFNVYYQDAALQGANTTTFHYLGGTNHLYAADAKNVYSDGRILPDADPNTFNIPKVIVPME